MTEDVTRDAFLGGRLHLYQPRKGYRAGIDPVLLAAAVNARPGQSVLDLGCGVGAAALCLGARIPGLDLLGVERQPGYAALARRNGLSVVEADLSDLPAGLKARSFDHVIANPPYFDRAASTPAENSEREGALGEVTPLGVWIDTAARRLRHKGYLHIIHRAERLPALLSLAQARFGSLELLPLMPRMGRVSELVILRARKGGRAAFRLHSPVLLHRGIRHAEDTEDYTSEIQKILRDAAPLWPGQATEN